MGMNPYAPSKASLIVPPPLDIPRVRKVAKWQRLLLLSIVLGISFFFIPSYGIFTDYDRIIAPILNLFFQLWCVVSLCEALSMQGSSWIYFLLMFLPLVNLITLLVLNAKATSFIRSCGFSVGLFGASIP